MKYNRGGITLKVDPVRDQEAVGSRSQSHSHYNETLTKKKAIALAILVGGEYNTYGRHIDLEKVNALRAQFKSLLSEMESLA